MQVPYSSFWAKRLCILQDNLPVFRKTKVTHNFLRTLTAASCSDGRWGVARRDTIRAVETKSMQEEAMPELILMLDKESLGGDSGTGPLDNRRHSEPAA